MKKIIVLALVLCLLCGCTAGNPAVSDSTAAPTETPTVTTVPTTVPTEDTVPTESVVPTTVPVQPKMPSLLDFLRIAVLPVGSTMYVWGGGWNETDTGAGIDAVTLGVSTQWAQFAALQDSTYDHNDTRYQIHDGLDCSGYVGWAVYNVLETENGKDGYVCSSTKMAKNLADKGLGEYIPAKDLTDWAPGDVMSMSGHCWIVVGMCEDGSVLLLHSSPPGVRFCGTLLPDGGESQAAALAKSIMQTHYPDWYNRYPICTSPRSYLEKSSAMRWSADVLADNENLRNMTAQQVVQLLFG